MKRAAGSRGRPVAGAAVAAGAGRARLLSDRPAARRAPAVTKSSRTTIRGTPPAIAGVQCGECHGSAPPVPSNQQLPAASIRTCAAMCRSRCICATATCRRCWNAAGSCHRQEFADWQAGPHSSTYARIFLDKKHNAKTPADGRLPALPRHAFRRRHCAIWSLPVNTNGTVAAGEGRTCGRVPRFRAWRATRCIGRGSQLQKAGEEGRVPGSSQEINRPSLALYDRRTQAHVSVARTVASGNEGRRRAPSR